MVTRDYAPRGIGRLIDDGIALYRANVRVIVPAALIVLLPLSLLASLGQIAYTRAVFLSSFATTRSPSLGQIGVLTMWYGLWLGATLAFSLAGLYYMSSVYASAPSLLAGEPLQPKRFLRDGWRRFGWLWLTTFVVGIIVQVGTIFLIVPGLIAAVWLSLSAAIVVLEGAPLDVALRRSLTLVRPNAWRVVAFWIGTGIVVTALQSAIGSFGSASEVLSAIPTLSRGVPLGWQIAGGLATGLGRSLSMPLMYLCTMVLYLDLRSRTEGMDLLMRAQALTGQR